MKSSEEALAVQGLRHAKNDRVYDWLREIASNVRTYLQAPAALLPFTGDKRLVEALEKAGKTERMCDLLKILGRDAQSYAMRFRTIYDKHSQRRGNSVNPDDLIASISLSQEYISLMQSYEQVVMTNMEEALSLLEMAGLDTKSIRLATDRSVVYDLLTPKA
jgi:hypothetical protein